MSDANDIFEERTAGNRKIPRQSLRIAVLGPNLEELRDAGTLKRYQIRDALVDLGHSPFFPEQYIDMSAPDWIGQERDLLIGNDVDLVIMLHTETTWGVNTEIANFDSFPAIRKKTAILFPKHLYKPDKSLSANTAQNYLVVTAYTSEQMEACQLVSECEKWAWDMQNGYWPGLNRSAQAF